jgi:hypothetical protein
MNGKALCLIYSEIIAVLEENNIGRYCNRKNKEKFKDCVGALRSEKWRL